MNTAKQVLLAGLAIAITATVPTSNGQELQGNGTPTRLDLPSSDQQRADQRLKEKAQRRAKGRLAKLDLDGDFNYDGTIRDEDPTDNGTYQRTPPGLIIGKGELSKLVLRLTPYEIDFEGTAVVTMEIAGVNRDHPTGEFSSFEQEADSVGRLRIWKDATRKILLLDSADPNRRYIEWVLDSELYPSNIPHVVPKTVYAEGIKPSSKFLGDLRILVTISRRADENAKKGLFSRFLKSKENGQYHTVFDHILLTVRDKPQPKEYVNENKENVWLIAQGNPVEPSPSGKK